MVVTVDYKIILFIFAVTVVTVISQKVGVGQISVGKATGATVPPLRVYFLRFWTGY